MKTGVFSETKPITFGCFVTWRPRWTAVFRARHTPANVVSNLEGKLITSSQWHPVDICRRRCSSWRCSSSVSAQLMRIRRLGLSSLQKVGGFKHGIWIFLRGFLIVCEVEICPSLWCFRSVMMSGPHRGSWVGHPDWCVHHYTKMGLHCWFKINLLSSNNAGGLKTNTNAFVLQPPLVIIGHMSSGTLALSSFIYYCQEHKFEPDFKRINN